MARIILGRYRELPNNEDIIAGGDVRGYCGVDINRVGD
jgi:hypothetical protein